ncbi:hypothetical protein SDC9_206734 [bioreactor metagenome]|uniref:Uncharacterized protein n=1 Tax=bioreactor metagenome TaxID=1076179 RepID=A0A645J6J8_9ZZZZ
MRERSSVDLESMQREAYEKALASREEAIAVLSQARADADAVRAQARASAERARAEVAGAHRGGRVAGPRDGLTCGRGLAECALRRRRHLAGRNDLVERGTAADRHSAARVLSAGQRSALH